MSMRTGYFLIAAVFFLLVWGTTRSGTGVALAAVLPVTQANVQKAIDALPPGTPESQKPDSLQDIVADSATYVGDEDALEFAPGTYDDIGELIITRPLTLRKDPSMEGDVVITGELLIQIRSKDVKVEGLTFRDIEVEKFTLLRRGERASYLVLNKPPEIHDGPIEVYLSEVTIPDFLLARKAAPKTASDPDRDHDYSTYTGQLTREELDKHVTNPDLWQYRPLHTISNDKGFPMSRGGVVTSYSSGKWEIAYQDQYWIEDSVAHILINPRYYGAEDSCPASENLTGIEITRNSFEGTELVAIRSLGPGLPVPRNQAGSCFVEVDVTGNTFRNIGIPDYGFLKDSDGNFIVDGDGKRIPIAYEVVSEYAIGFFNFVRRSTIADNTIEGTTHNPIAIRSTPQGGRITIRNNVIRSTSAAGTRFPETQIDIRGRADDVKIMITGNRLLGSDDAYPYFVTTFDAFRRRANWCAEPDITGVTTVAELEELIQPRIWRSYVSNFPYPGGDGPARPMPPDAPPVKLGDVVVSYSGNNATLVPNAVIGSHDVVRHRNCHPTSRIEIRNQKGVSVTNNDLGYGEEGYVKYGITLRGAGTTLAEFEGNNFDYIEEGVIGSFAGNEARVSAKGNYLGLRLYDTSNLDGDGEPKPIVRGEGDVLGPRPGMTVENPPVVPRIQSAAVSSSDRKVIVLTYSAALVALDEESESAAGAFTVRYQVAQGVTGIIEVDMVEVDGSTITLTLREEIPRGASGVTIAYDSTKAGGSLVRTRTGTAVRDGEVMLEDDSSADGGMTPSGPGGGTVSGGDGGCSLASSGSGGIGFGALLLFTLAALAFGRKPVGN